MSDMLHTYGLIGTHLTHSQSPHLFAKKFANHVDKTLSYGLFELADITELPTLFKKQPTLRGVNVTFPYKEAVCAYVDVIHPLAARIGAINVLKKEKNGRWYGYNTDYAGFTQTLSGLPKGVWQERPALICGQGGAGRAVGCALEDAGIETCYLSRIAKQTGLTYSYLQAHPLYLQRFGLLVQATPLGTYPNTEAPLLPYTSLQPTQLLYDLAYNPPHTPFLQAGERSGCFIKNGKDMLSAQAEAAWDIWCI